MCLIFSETMYNKTNFLSICYFVIYLLWLVESNFQITVLFVLLCACLCLKEPSPSPSPRIISKTNSEEQTDEGLDFLRRQSSIRDRKKVQKQIFRLTAISLVQ
jgi:hypothetical protein